MSMVADLHAHTTASDGQYTPTELVRLARQHGVQVLAVTDHDTIDGVDEAKRAGASLGLQVIRGVELSAKEYHNLHILGYGFRDGDTELFRLCERQRMIRDDRNHRLFGNSGSYFRQGVVVLLLPIDQERTASPLCGFGALPTI